MLGEESSIVELIKMVDMDYLEFKREEYEIYNPDEEKDNDDVKKNRKKTNKQKASLQASKLYNTAENKAIIEKINLKKKVKLIMSHINKPF